MATAALPAADRAAADGAGPRKWRTWLRRAERRAYTASLRCKLERARQLTGYHEAVLACVGGGSEREAAILAAHRLQAAAWAWTPTLRPRLPPGGVA